MSTLDQLLEMGFSEAKSQRAVAATGNQGIGPAMEWILEHNDDIEDESVVEGNVTNNVEASTKENPEGVENSVEPSNEGEADHVRSYKCLDCNKMFKSDVELEYHAVKSGHKNFAESTEDVKPLSDEEKKEQLRKLEERIKCRRMEREERERLEGIESERNRRRTGQELAMAKQKMEEEEIKRIAEEKRREKLEEKMARQRVLDAIERDKMARRQKFAMPGQTEVVKEEKKEPESVPAPAKKDYSHCKLQIRLTNGQALMNTFGANEELSAVRLYIQLNRTDGSAPFCLMTTFPKKVFTEEDMVKPLGALGLVPSAVITVSKVN